MGLRLFLFTLVSHQPSVCVVCVACGRPAGPHLYVCLCALRPRATDERVLLSFYDISLCVLLTKKIGSKCAALGVGGGCLLLGWKRGQGRLGLGGGGMMAHASRTFMRMGLPPPFFVQSGIHPCGAPVDAFVCLSLFPPSYILGPRAGSGLPQVAAHASGARPNREEELKRRPPPRQRPHFLPPCLISASTPSTHPGSPCTSADHAAPFVPCLAARRGAELLQR